MDRNCAAEPQAGAAKALAPWEPGSCSSQEGETVVAMCNVGVQKGPEASKEVSPEPSLPLFIPLPIL